MQTSSDTDKGVCVDGEDVSLQFSLQESEDGNPDLMVLSLLLRMVQPTLTVVSNGSARGGIKPLITLGCVFQLLMWTTLGVMVLLVERHLFDCLEVTGYSDLKARGAEVLNLLLFMPI
jgi:hypothetical protein